MPGYWMYESTGVLRPVIEKYLGRETLTRSDIGVMRAYLRQWINGPWLGDDIEALRAAISELSTREQIDAWLDQALDLGIDPL